MKTSGLIPIETTTHNDLTLDWYDLLDLGLEGRAFPAEQCEHPYDRLPAAANSVVTEAVWNLSRQSAGLRARFVTEAPTIHARWSFRPGLDPAGHIPRSGSHGLDLYAHDGYRFRWVGKGLAAAHPTTQAVLCDNLPPQQREFLLYLPYRMAIDSVYLGIPTGCAIQAATPPAHQPLCFYGTSIVHGASASRAGMTYPAMVSRRLGRPFYNFGFGGNGPMHLEMARILADLGVSAFIVAGCENMSPELVAERTKPFAGILREKHPTTPIVFISNLRYADAWIIPGRQQNQDGKNTNLAAAVQRLQDAGDANIHLVPGPLVGDDDEATIDGTHPTDLGFARMADHITPVVEQLVVRRS